MTKRHKVSIVGMHCKSCEKVIHDELMNVEGIKSASVSLRNSEAIIQAKDEIDDIEIEKAIKRAGYKVGNEDRPIVSRESSNWIIFVCGIILSLIIFWIFKSLGITPNISSNNGSGTYALLMGLTAGFSTCMALVGGLVVGISAHYMQNNPGLTRAQSFRPHIFFNIGRIVGFAILGGLLGLIGSVFSFSPSVMGIMTLLAGIFMLVIGLQLTGIFPRLSTLSLPPKIAEKLGIDNHKTKKYNPWRSILVGGLTFFLPCGFTQAMQLFSISTGSPWIGALTMGLFAIGTTPGLLLVGGATSFMRGKKGKIALKLVGTLVAMLALLSINSGLNLTGFKLPAINFSNNDSHLEIPRQNAISLTFRDNKFDKDEIVLKKGQTYRITINPQEDGSGCMSTVMLPGITNSKPQLIETGKPITFTLTAQTVGEYQFVCAMGISFNTVIKVEE